MQCVFCCYKAHPETLWWITLLIEYEHNSIFRMEFMSHSRPNERSNCVFIIGITMLSYINPLIWGHKLYCTKFTTLKMCKNFKVTMTCLSWPTFHEKCNFKFFACSHYIKHCNKIKADNCPCLETIEWEKAGFYTVSIARLQSLVYMYCIGLFVIIM